jgi:hypothetical protein
MNCNGPILNGQSLVLRASLGRKKLLGSLAGRFRPALHALGAGRPKPLGPAGGWLVLSPLPQIRWVHFEWPLVVPYCFSIHKYLGRILTSTASYTLT